MTTEKCFELFAQTKSGEYVNAVFCINDSLEKTLSQLYQYDLGHISMHATDISAKALHPENWAYIPICHVLANALLARSTSQLEGLGIDVDLLTFDLEPFNFTIEKSSGDNTQSTSFIMELDDDIGTPLDRDVVIGGDNINVMIETDQVINTIPYSSYIDSMTIREAHRHCSNSELSVVITTTTKNPQYVVKRTGDHILNCHFSFYDLNVYKAIIETMHTSFKPEIYQTMFDKMKISYDIACFSPSDFFVEATKMYYTKGNNNFCNQTLDYINVTSMFKNVIIVPKDANTLQHIACDHYGCIIDDKITTVSGNVDDFV